MTPILVFAKAPEPGKVKTRLCPPLSPEEAAALHRNLVRHTLRTAIRAELGPVSLYCAPDTDHPFFQHCARDYGIELRPQTGRDLGARMAGALAQTLQSAEQALLIGSDCPSLTETDLAAAGRALRDGRDAVLGPAEDGGYVLIGLRRPQPTLFTSMHWGGSTVLDATRQRLLELNLSWEELPPRWDLDRPDDLLRLRRELPGLTEPED